MAKPNYEKPASQLDLEARQKKDYVPEAVLVQGSDAELSDNGYIGVDPVYQNYASETERPFLAESGPESKIEQNYVSEDVDTTLGAAEEGESEEEDDEEEEEEEVPTPSSSTPPSGSSTPPSNS